ncbi:MAG: hypothetical protein AAGE86_09240 [Pseudomonadota bacterium]
MVKRTSPHSSAPKRADQASIAEAKDKLKALGGLGEGLGKLLEGVAELSEKGGSTKDGEFSIGGPDSKLKGAYRMKFGTLEDAAAERARQAARPKKPVKPFEASSESVADGFAPNLFETAQGAMIVAEVGAHGEDQVSVIVNEERRGAVVTTPDASAAIDFSKAVCEESLSVTIVNGIMTANLDWKE